MDAKTAENEPMSDIRVNGPLFSMFFENIFHYHSDSMFWVIGSF